MIRQALIIFLLLSVMSVVACDSEKDTFSGLSDLVAERNEVRRAISKESRKKKNLTTSSDQTSDVNSEQPAYRDVLSSGVLYEKNIEIVDSYSRRPLAKGVAYMNKKGRIVKIKILKD